MKTSYLTFLGMIYHYQILLLDNLRKSPLEKSSLLERSLSSTVDVFKPVQKASTSRDHDTESAIEFKSEIKQTSKFTRTERAND